MDKVIDCDDVAKIDTTKPRWSQNEGSFMEFSNQPSLNVTSSATPSQHWTYLLLLTGQSLTAMTLLRLGERVAKLALIFSSRSLSSAPGSSQDKKAKTKGSCLSHEDNILDY